MGEIDEEIKENKLRKIFMNKKYEIECLNPLLKIYLILI